MIQVLTWAFIASTLRPCADPSFMSVFEIKSKSYKERPHPHTHIGEICQGCSCNSDTPLTQATNFIKSFLLNLSTLQDKCTYIIGMNN